MTIVEAKLVAEAHTSVRVYEIGTAFKVLLAHIEKLESLALNTTRTLIKGVETLPDTPRSVIVGTLDGREAIARWHGYGTGWLSRDGTQCPLGCLHYWRPIK